MSKFICVSLKYCIFTLTFSMKLPGLLNEDYRFNEHLISVIDNTLSDMLGEEAKRATYKYLKEVHSLETKNLSHELATLDLGLKKLFGSVARIIENQIVNEIFSQINLSLTNDDTFPNLIEKARNQYNLETHSSIRLENINQKFEGSRENQIHTYHLARTIAHLATSLMALYMTTSVYLQAPTTINVSSGGVNPPSQLFA